MSFRKNVFVLGAGFSADAGAPIIENFFSCARELKENPVSILTDRDREVFDRVIRYRLELDPAVAKVFANLDNIEQLFGFLEMDLQLSSRRDENLREDMPYLIVRTLEATMNESLPCGYCRLITGPKAATKFSYQYQRNRYSFFVGFVSGLWNPKKRKDSQSIDSVITFNYDLILEREMVDLGLAPTYPGPLMDYSGAFSEAKLGLHLLKMHGSANWLVCSRCKDVIYVRVPQEAEISRAKSQPCPRCRQLSLLPFIVPPTWNKGIEEKFIRPVWHKALEELMSAGRLFIVGYSLPDSDQFFKYLLGLALARNNEISEIYVVNPSDEVIDRFKQFFSQHLHHRIQYQPRRTHEFIEKIQELTKQDFDQTNLASQLFIRG